MNLSIVSVTIRREHDVVNARQRARHLAELLSVDTLAVLSKESFTTSGALEEVRRALTKAGIDA